MDSNYEEDELLQEAVDGGYVEDGSKEHGIARLCIDRGYETLSPAQKAVYDREVLPALKKLQSKKHVVERMRGMPD